MQWTLYDLLLQIQVYKVKFVIPLTYFRFMKICNRVFCSTLDLMKIICKMASKYVQFRGFTKFQITVAFGLKFIGI